MKNLVTICLMIILVTSISLVSVKKKEVKALGTEFSNLVTDTFQAPIGDFIVNGDYIQLKDSEFTSGAIWSKEKLSLIHDFEIEASVFLGSSIEKLGEGLVFALQNDPKMVSIPEQTIGFGEENLGLYSFTGIKKQLNQVPPFEVSNYLALEFDYVNNPVLDSDAVAGPHFSFVKNRLMYSYTPSDTYYNGINHLSVRQIPDIDKLANGKWKDLKIVYNAVEKKISFSLMEGDVILLSHEFNPVVSELFNNYKEAYFGFTSGTSTGTSDLKIAFKSVKKTILPKSIKFDLNTVHLEMNETIQMNATVLPENAENSLEWFSSDEGIVEVDSIGNVTAIAPGTALISAKTVNGLVTEATITVTELGQLRINEISPIIFPKSKISQFDQTVRLDPQTTPTTISIEDSRSNRNRTSWELQVKKEMPLMKESTLHFFPFNETNLFEVPSHLKITEAFTSFAKTNEAYLNEETAMFNFDMARLDSEGVTLTIPGNTPVGEYSTNLIWMLIEGP